LIAVASCQIPVASCQFQLATGYWLLPSQLRHGTIDASRRLFVGELVVISRRLLHPPELAR